MKYQKDAAQLLSLLGGKKNIDAVAHCMTRMRFILCDEKLANIKAIETITSIKGTFTQAGQFQVIIGNDVASFYQSFMHVSGLNHIKQHDIKQQAKRKQNLMQRAMTNLAEIFAPIIPSIIVGGLILGFSNLMSDVKFLHEGTRSITDLYPFWAGVNHFLWLISEAIFHFLPVAITWSVVKKMGGTESLGIVLGITLVSPQLLNAYSVIGIQELPFWDFGFVKVAMIGYQAQVIPAMLAAFVFSYLERFFRRITPNAIAMIFVPFCSLVPTVLIAHTIVGPVGWKIGNFISTIVHSGLTSDLNWLFASIFGFLYAPIVITGLHHMSNAIDLELVAQYGGTILWPMIALSNIAQGSAVIAMLWIRHDKNIKEVGIPAAISCYLGVTEPAIFGINIKYGYPFLAAMFGSSAAATYSVLMGVSANSIGVGGLPGILSIQTNHMFNFAIAMLIAIVASIILTFLFANKGHFKSNVSQ